jgi:hypothetical protein
MTNLFEINEKDYRDLVDRAKHWSLVNGMIENCFFFVKNKVLYFKIRFYIDEQRSSRRIRTSTIYTLSITIFLFTF